MISTWRFAGTFLVGSHLWSTCPFASTVTLGNNPEDHRHDHAEISWLQLWWLRFPQRRMHVCPNPDSYLKTCFSPFCYKPPHSSFQWGTPSLRHEAAVTPRLFAWQSKKAIFFSFTQNSVSTFQFGTGRQRLNSSNTTTANPSEGQVTTWTCHWHLKEGRQSCGVWCKFQVNSIQLRWIVGLPAGFGELLGGVPPSHTHTGIGTRTFSGVRIRCNAVYSLIPEIQTKSSHSSLIFFFPFNFLKIYF